MKWLEKIGQITPERLLYIIYDNDCCHRRNTPAAGNGWIKPISISTDGYVSFKGTMWSSNNPGTLNVMSTTVHIPRIIKLYHSGELNETEKYFVKYFVFTYTILDIDSLREFQYTKSHSDFMYNAYCIFNPDINSTNCWNTIVHHLMKLMYYPQRVGFKLSELKNDIIDFMNSHPHYLGYGNEIKKIFSEATSEQKKDFKKYNNTPDYLLNQKGGFFSVLFLKYLLEDVLYDEKNYTPSDKIGNDVGYDLDLTFLPNNTLGIKLEDVEIIQPINSEVSPFYVKNLGGAYGFTPHDKGYMKDIKHNKVNSPHIILQNETDISTLTDDDLVYTDTYYCSICSYYLNNPCKWKFVKNDEGNKKFYRKILASNFIDDVPSTLDFIKTYSI